MTWESGPGVVAFPNGRVIRGRSLRRGAPSQAPEFGVYLGSHEPGPFDWESRWVRWPDFRCPSSSEDALDAIAAALSRADSCRVEIACTGGLGRTGTALAAAAVMSGVDPAYAVAWIRTHYHRRAIETPWQKRWVRSLSAD